MAKALACISPAKSEKFSTLEQEEREDQPVNSSAKRKLEDICSCSVQLPLKSDLTSLITPLGSSLNKPRPFTVSIEGNIGSGKSTFLKHFSEVPGVATFQEPLSKWTDCGSHNLLDMLYKDTTRWNFLFQSYVQLTRLDIHLARPEAAVKLIERSLQNNRFCFVENAYKEGYLQDSEYDTLVQYFNFFEKSTDIGVDLIVYLRTSPEVVYERVKKRERSEEATMPFSYLQSVHKHYEKWLVNKMPEAPPAPVLIIDANKDIDSVIKDLESNRMTILGKGDKRADSSKKTVS